MQTKTILTALLTLGTGAFAETIIPMQEHTVSMLVHSEHAVPQHTQIQDRAIRNWKLSLIPLIASQTLDITSSYGMRELNPMLASSNGEFGGKAASIKIGTTAAIVGLEYLIVKAHPGSAKVFSKLNWSGAALTSTFAAHNYMIK